jgi:hypothetical protein
MKIGIVGKGYFGKKIYNKLSSLYDIVFFTGREFSVTTDIDWAIVASSTDSHYEVVKYFLLNRVNVFAEKPLTLSYKQSYELVQLANQNDVHLYIDDVFLYHPTYCKVKEQSFTKLSFSWNKYGSFKDGIGSNLAYHDIYMALDLGYSLDSDIKFEVNRVNEKVFTIGDVSFKYNRLSHQKSKTVKAGRTLYSFNTEADPLSEMLTKVLAEEVDFRYNNKLALKAQAILDKVNNNKPTVSIIGGGVFGTTTALILQEDFDVTLIERHESILQEASGINQYRLHRGYHYPRSVDTAISSKKGTETFTKYYDCQLPNPEQYYVVANYNSKVTAKSYEAFMNKVELTYTKEDLDIINQLEAEAIYKVEEGLFDHQKLREVIEDRLQRSSVKVQLGREVDSSQLTNYDYVINATYSNTNTLTSNKKIYQFELCEKPIIKLPKEFKGKGVVVVDGPFTCIDPFGDTGYHVVGNVVHAIHHNNNGVSPEIPSAYKSLLNNGVVENPAITNFPKFKKDLQKYFNGLDSIEHIGSMFTIRTVLADRDHDDARPSIVEKEDSSLYRIFSGKISTAVDTAHEVLNSILTS